MHAFDAQADMLVTRSAMTDRDVERSLEAVRARAGSQMSGFLQRLNLTSVSAVLRFGSPVEEIRNFARDHNADVIVLGTHGYSAIEKLVLGSVVAEVMRTADRDVLAIPPQIAN